MKIVKKKIVDLMLAGYNPRKDLKPGDRDYENLKKSILEFDYIDPIIWNKQTGNVVGGHQRIKVLKDLGYTELEVSVVDLPIEKEKALNIGLNKISGDWDKTKLEDLLRELTSVELDMDLTGFDESELDELLGTKSDIVEDNFDVDAALERIETPVSVAGDVWVLGDHQLICGDSTKLTDVKQLMGGEKADMVFTDPPYNVALGMDETPEEAKKRNRRTDGLIVKNDKMSDEKFYDFLYDSFVSMYASLKPGGALYVCHADSEGLNFRRAFKESGFLLKQCLIWAKNSLVMGRQDYHWRHEPILYGWKPGAAHKWYGGHKETTIMKEDPAVLIEKMKNGKHKITFDTGLRTIEFEVADMKMITDVDDSLTSTWFFNKPVKSVLHPTMKPVGLPGRAMKNSTKPGDIVLDPFGGSGSTLIAAEQIGRGARLIELDPKYCDVIVQRWEEFTGKKAEKRGGGTYGIARTGT